MSPGVRACAHACVHVCVRGHSRRVAACGGGSLPQSLNSIFVWTRETLPTYFSSFRTCTGGTSPPRHLASSVRAFFLFL